MLLTYYTCPAIMSVIFTREFQNYIRLEVIRFMKLIQSNSKKFLSPRQFRTLFVLLTARLQVPFFHDNPQHRGNRGDRNLMAQN